GVTLFKIDKGLDTGDIVGVVETMIEPNENFGRLLERLTFIGTSLLGQELPRLLTGVAKLAPQTGEVTLAPKIERSMAKLSVADDAETALNKVLAFNPEPMAWLEFNGEPLRVLEAIISTQSIRAGALEPATRGVLVGFANNSALELITLQPAGKPVMKATDWFRGTKPEERTIS
ncbi:MAG: hypothetical protein ORN27_11125, partial [Rhodoluna sp.]|nr:hypothetical protein [Rhodoluna sp.]